MYYIDGRYWSEVLIESLQGSRAEEVAKQIVDYFDNEEVKCYDLDGTMFETFNYMKDTVRYLKEITEEGEIINFLVEMEGYWDDKEGWFPYDKDQPLLSSATINLSNMENKARVMGFIQAFVFLQLEVSFRLIPDTSRPNRRKSLEQK